MVVKYFDAFLNLIPLSFVLGFYVSYVASRWWQQFLAIPWPDKLFHSVACFVDGFDEESRMLRHGHHESSGHLWGKGDLQQRAYANLVFIKLNLVETFGKGFKYLQKILLIAVEGFETYAMLLMPHEWNSWQPITFSNIHSGLVRSGSIGS